MEQETTTFTKKEENWVDLKNHFIELPKSIGGYAMGEKQHCIKFMLTKKPICLHRYFCKLLLGWRWEDEK